MQGKIPWKAMLLLAVLPLAACKELAVREEAQVPPYRLVTAEGVEERTLQDLLPELARKRVIYVGETHSVYGHHLLQLAVIRGLYEQGVDLAIGMEFFQQPFQKWLDAWIAGELSEAEMLEKTQWYDRWRFDYRLYRPLLRFAREHGIPIIALNVPRELTDKVSQKGLAGLSRDERAQLPAEIDRSDQAYRQRLHEVFSRHQKNDESRFERFLDVQYSWDEGMAERIADYLRAHPEKTLVVLAGSGHLAYGSGIPNRVARRLPVSSVILLPADTNDEPEKADYLVGVEQRQLPPKGLMGVMIGQAEDGVVVEGVTPHSAAEGAGVKPGDRIRRIGGAPVATLTDVRLLMLDKRPGDQVQVRFERDGKPLEMTLTLGRRSH